MHKIAFNIVFVVILLLLGSCHKKTMAASYSRCMSCHTKHDTGFGIPLSKIKTFKKDYIRKVILNGKGNMPKQSLTYKQAQKIAEDIKRSQKF